MGHFNHSRLLSEVLTMVISWISPSIAPVAIVDSSSDGRLYHFRLEKFFNTGKLRLDRTGSWFSVMLQAASSEVEESERRLATYSTSMLPAITLIPSSAMSWGPSAAMTRWPLNCEHCVMSDTSCSVLIVNDWDMGVQSM